ncbi:MAG: TerC/Alx family metal homeostasis membrane protein [Candidatus Bathyarchaeota archaeon]
MQEIPITFWIAFHVIVALLLFIDLSYHGRASKLNFRRDVIWSIIWIAAGLAFGVFIFWYFGYRGGLEYFTAYIVEKSLSVDNLFVFIVIFNYFAVPFVHQHKTLFLGILGAMIFRSIFIFAGIALLGQFNWMIYVFGAVLLYSGYALARGKMERVDPEKNRIVKIARRFLPISSQYVGGKFTSKKSGKIIFTPLILALLAIETTDILFAFDSIPAVLAITQEFYIAYTSNIMAILGLRALYFVLANALRRLVYLSKGLAIVLSYLGFKFIVSAFGIEIPTLLSLFVVSGIVLICILASIFKEVRHSRI